MQIGGRVASPNRGYHEAARILISAGNKINHAPIALAWGEGGGEGSLMAESVEISR